MTENMAYPVILLREIFQQTDSAMFPLTAFPSENQIHIVLVLRLIHI